MRKFFLFSIITVTVILFFNTLNVAYSQTSSPTAPPSTITDPPPDATPTPTPTPMATPTATPTPTSTPCLTCAPGDNNCKEKHVKYVCEGTVCMGITNCTWDDKVTDPKKQQCFCK